MTEPRIYIPAIENTKPREVTALPQLASCPQCGARTGAIKPKRCATCITAPVRARRNLGGWY